MLVCWQKERHPACKGSATAILYVCMSVCVDWELSHSGQSVSMHTLLGVRGFCKFTFFWCESQIFCWCQFRACILKTSLENLRNYINPRKDSKFWKHLRKAVCFAGHLSVCSSVRLDWACNCSWSALMLSAVAVPRCSPLGIWSNSRHVNYLS